MLITADVACSPVCIPSVTAPTPDEMAALVACGEEIAAGLAAGLTELCTTSCNCSVAGPPVVNPPAATAGDEILFWWGQAAPDWQLWLPRAAGEDILASVLGSSSLNGDYPISCIDRALLELQCQKAAQQVTQRMGLPVPLQHGVCLVAAETPLPSVSQVQFTLRLLLHGRAHLARLLVSRDRIKSLLPSAPQQINGIGPALLAGAMVTVEAILRGPTLTAEQLLGLECGDVVCLGEAAQEALLQAEGVTIGKGRPGGQAGRLAVNIREISTFSEATYHGS